MVPKMIFTVPLPLFFFNFAAGLREKAKMDAAMPNAVMLVLALLPGIAATEQMTVHVVIQHFLCFPLSGTWHRRVFFADVFVVNLKGSVLPPRYRVRRFLKRYHKRVLRPPPPVGRQSRQRAERRPSGAQRMGPEVHGSILLSVALFRLSIRYGIALSEPRPERQRTRRPEERRHYLPRLSPQR